jgi:Flp pilus assembly protein TadB
MVIHLFGLKTRYSGNHFYEGQSGPVKGRIFTPMVILLAFLVVLLFAGLGFALHFLWIVAAVLLILWLVGFAMGRGESAGNRRFYRW